MVRPTNGIKYVEEITEVLKDKSSDAAAKRIQQRADQYIDELDALDTEAKSKFKDVPETNVCW
ncbi:Periplasmic solute binding protein family [Weissella viridescens]|uniref:Periplasmic solute binding protein family n=1 Tax=Weissella viridescens TaxID=1629 RepID=A0A380NXJ8_WEIVI|nr:Periplasmic solute binding protein family [Weissella viridescens]